MAHRILYLFTCLFRRRRMEDDLDEELRTGFELLVDRYIARGMTDAAARRAARIEFEGLEQVKERVREGLAGSALRTLLQDLHYAWRSLRRRPSFAVIALITLALGIGVNTAVFSVFYNVLMRSLPYKDPERLVRIWGSFRTAGASRAPISGTMFREIEVRNRSFEGVGGIWVIAPRNVAGENPEQIKFAHITVNFFGVLGVRPTLGRNFAPQDNGGPSMILTSGFFQRRFGGDTRLLGKALPVQGENTLIGVLPADFELQFTPDANVPPDVKAFAPFSYGIYNERTAYYLRVVARMKPGVSLSEAQRDLDRVSAEIRAAYTEFGSIDLRLFLSGLQDDALRDIQPGLAALLAGAGCILLICCVNVSSLLLARANERRKEIALRLALGASRGRILRQLLVEGGLLSLIGGTTGVAVGWGVFRGLQTIRPERFTRMGEAGINWPVLAFAAGSSVVAPCCSASCRQSKASGWT